MRERIADIHPGCAVAGDRGVRRAGQLAGAGCARHPVDAVIDACDQVQRQGWRSPPGRAQTRHAVRHRRRGRRQARGAHGRGRRPGRRSRTTRCSRSCASACARSTARRAKAARSAWPACSGARAWRRPSVVRASRSTASLNCHGYGSVVGVTATFGQCAAGWALDRIARAGHAIIAGFAGFDRRQTKHGSSDGTLAQLVEQRTFNPLVTGSNPVRPTRNQERVPQRIGALFMAPPALKTSAPPQRRSSIRSGSSRRTAPVAASRLVAFRTVPDAWALSTAQASWEDLSTFRRFGRFASGLHARSRLRRQAYSLRLLKIVAHILGPIAGVAHGKP